MSATREELLARVRDRGATPWDIAVVGGGATGLGTALDAASRGYDVVLVERSDFAKGTSSRSTKLVHGGVRYLQQGNVSLVMEALKERGRLRRLAPHLVHDLAFIVPTYEWWESPFYGVGLKVYDLLAGRYGFGRSTLLSRDEVIAAIPTIETDGLRGGVRYYDGQFDDARLAIDLVATALEQGAVALNYVEAAGLLKRGDGALEGLAARDVETGETFEVRARVVVNATGPFADELRRMDDPGAEPIIAPSQGVHVVLDRSFIPHDAAIMVPHTADDRVMFAIPWYDRVVVGTTDTALDAVAVEPRPRADEVEFILETANRYLARPARHDDIRSVFAGIRPLVRAGGAAATSALSREHTVLIEPTSGLLTVAGGKWTTYRAMADDVVDHAATLADLEPRECRTASLPIHGCDEGAARHGRLAPYGSDAPEVADLIAGDPALGRPVHPRLDLLAGEVVWACRREWARTVDDVLARRSRSLILDAAAAAEAAPAVAALVAAELGRDEAWQSSQVAAFAEIAALYRP